MLKNPNVKNIKYMLSDEQIEKVMNMFKISIQNILNLTSDEIKYLFIINLLKLITWGSAKRITIRTCEIISIYNSMFDDCNLRRNTQTRVFKPYKHTKKIDIL